MQYPQKVRLWEILIRPSLWFRNDPTDEEFDSWLTDAMDRGEPASLSINPMSSTIYEVEIAGLDVWIESPPFADATSYGSGPGKHSASRRTALRLRRALAPLLREHFRFQPPTSKQTA